MFTNIKFKGRLIFTSTLCIFLAGCSFGPGVMKSSRSEYNRAVHQSANEELLLNIVRLRYREPMQFLQISNITSQYSYSQNLNLNGKIPGNGANVLTAIGGFGYTEKPTISYKPMEGKQFVNRFLEETSLKSILLLIRSGWDIERICRIMMDSIGELNNLPMHTSYSKLIELVQLWDRMQQRGDLSFSQFPGKEKIVVDSIPEDKVDVENLLSVLEAGYSMNKNKDGQYNLTKKGKPMLVMQLKYRNQAEAEKGDALLNITPQHMATPDGGRIEYIQFVDPLIDDVKKDSKNGMITKVSLKLRSFSNQLYAIAKGIEVPEKDKAIIKTYVNAQGQTEEIRMAFNDLLNIQSSLEEPDNALVAIQYRDSWFYIDQDDRQSVSTLSLLILLYSLQAGEEAAGPVLTLPL